MKPKFHPIHLAIAAPSLVVILFVIITQSNY